MTLDILEKFADSRFIVCLSHEIQTNQNLKLEATSSLTVQ
jgi:hypothetical protein